MKYDKIAYPYFDKSWHWVVFEEVTEDDLCCIHQQFVGETLEND